MECNATLTTATVGPCPETNHPYPDTICDGDHHVTLHTIKCSWSVEAHTHAACHAEEGAGPYDRIAWDDDTPGATPHTPPLVSDDEVGEALQALDDLDCSQNLTEHEIRVALEAAAKVRNSRE